MSVKRVKSVETKAYRGNEVRLLDGNGKLLRTLTIEEFRKERSSGPDPARVYGRLPVSTKPSKLTMKRGTQQNGWNTNDAAFGKKSGNREDHEPEDINHIVADYRGTQRYDRARSGGE